jgi:CHAT domain-containing protein
MKSCTKFSLLCFFCVVPALLFGRTSASKDVVHEVADEAASQVSTASAPLSVPPQATTDTVEPEKVAGLRAFVDEYYAAYSKKDIEAVMALWSSQSPDLAARRESFQKFFAANDKITVSNVEIKDAKFENSKVRFRVTLEMSATDIKSGKPASDLGKITRDFACVKEQQAWRLFAESDAVEELASALVATATEQERNALLEREKELATAALAGALIQKATSFADAEDTARMLIALGLAQRVAEQAGDQAALAGVYRDVARLQAQNNNNYVVALELYKKSLAITEKLGNRRLSASNLNNIGTSLAKLDDEVAAVDYYRRALAIAESLHDDRLTVLALHGIVGFYVFEGNYREIKNYLERALAVAERSGGPPRTLARIYNDLGNTANEQDDYAHALAYYQKGLSLVEKGVDPGMEADLLGSIGGVFTTTNDFSEALAYYHKSLTLNQQLGAKGKDSVSWMLQAIGEVESRQHNYDAALSDYGKSLTLAEELGNKVYMADLQRDIGDIYELRGEHAPAVDWHRKSLALAEQMNHQRLIGDVCNSLSADYYAQGAFDKALEFAERTSGIVRNTGRREALIEARTHAGKAYRALGQAPAARAAFEEAVNTVEAVRADVAGGEQEKQRFFETEISPYQEMVELLVDQNHNSEALLFAERAKGRTLLDVLHSGKIEITKAMTEAERSREREMEDNLVSLNLQMQREKQQSKPEQQHLDALGKQLDEARVAYNEFHASLYVAHPELRTQRGQVPLLGLDDAAQMLPKSGAFLEFFVADESTYLFVITKKEGQAAPELEVYPIKIKQEELASRVEEFRQKLAQRDLTERARGRALYNLLLKPAAAQLAGKDALVIFPDGPLWNLPFQATQTSNRYLLEKYAIAYSPSLTVLRETMTLHEKKRKELNTQSSTLLAMADPALSTQKLTDAGLVLRGEKLEPLPEARHEVRVLKQFYGAPQSEIYTGAEAREDRFKAEAGKFRILHLATHGILDNASPMYSNILLSGGDNGQEDGLLEAREIMQMDLKADLAVLSACETARGRISAGEGVIGLSWAFFVAGTSTTVVSQWKVESASTADLMLAFHRALMAAPKSGGDAFSTARALQRAEIRLLRSPKYAHPFYWAGFIVVGDPR